MAAVQKGLAGAPIGKPRRAADMMALLPAGNGPAVPDAPNAPVLVSAASVASVAGAASTQGADRLGPQAKKIATDPRMRLPN